VCATSVAKDSRKFQGIRIIYVALQQGRAVWYLLGSVKTFNFMVNCVSLKKVKFSPLQALEALRVVRG
jgi:hypothetical protein